MKAADGDISEIKTEFGFTAQKLKAKESALTDFCEQTNLRRDRYREQVFAVDTEKKIANFGRSTSSKAVWANKKALTNGENGGIININKDTIDFSYPMKGFDNKSIREWYVANVNDIRNRIDISKSVEEQTRQAFELRIKYRQIARNHMSDVETAQMLNKKYPSKSFDELVQDKINRKGLSREQAIEDILKTATKTNADVNKEFGL